MVCDPACGEISRREGLNASSGELHESKRIRYGLNVLLCLSELCWHRSVGQPGAAVQSWFISLAQSAGGLQAPLVGRAFSRLASFETRCGSIPGLSGENVDTMLFNESSTLALFRCVSLAVEQTANGWRLFADALRDIKTTRLFKRAKEVHVADSKDEKQHQGQVKRTGLITLRKLVCWHCGHDRVGDQTMTSNEALQQREEIE